jgi:6-pyruvoyl-tetrahydropterin synthase
MSKKIIEMVTRALCHREVNYTWSASGFTLLTMEKFAEYVLDDFLDDNPNKEQLIKDYLIKIKSNPYEPNE